MRIVFLGSGDIGVPSLQAIADCKDHQLVRIFTQPARKAGRKQKLAPTPAAVWAAENNVDCTETENINSPETLKEIADCNAELMVVIAFGQFISQEAINIQPHRAINAHASIIPNYRGAGPVNWAVLNGDKKTGISIITVENKMDTGDVLDIAEIPIKPYDDAESVHYKLAMLAPHVLMIAIDNIAEGTAVYIKQDDSKATEAPKLKKTDGYIDFAQPAQEINNKIRGLWSWPGAQADFVSAKTQKCVRVTFAQAQVVSSGKNDTRHGRLDDDLNIICGKGTLKILKIKPAGSGLMDFKAFANGRALAPGDMFLTIEKN
ncbi:MAG: methionyl-tRNA formyltransferase [Planctomycetes bacterium]|nr:methionyl-tRNA formyltransferase [Planctomycetota bacterium]